ncbi:MAG: efflux RND transporter periplasmic adaptor subunit [Pirellulales bacterium]|nr:efflux RND transporter periplasmic adaptor subunit [Pirellulales bacterium]
MSSVKQRQTVLVGSVGLSALLVGSLVGGLAMWRSAREQMRDPAFLRMQLESVSPESDSPDAGSPPALVRVGVARRKAIQPQRPIIGRLVEVRKATLASEVTGKIVDLPVEEGTPVVADKTVLARIDDVWCSLALERCQTQEASIAARLDFERLELQRQQQLSDRGAISQSELQSKQATVDELEASLAGCRIAQKEEGERVQRSEILAPFDGTVIAKHAELGGHVLPGTPIVDIVSRGQVDARLMVPESVVNLVSLGQVLPIRVDPLGDEVQGKVVSVTPYGPTASRTFPVRVRFDDQQGRLKVGMSVTALIAMGPEREALVVSKDAVLVRPDGSTVWVAVAGEAEQAAEVQPVPVQISARMQQEYAVEPETERGRQLLAPGAQVVVEGAERLMPGQQVRIVTLDGGPDEVAGPSRSRRQPRPITPQDSAGGRTGDEES